MSGVSGPRPFFLNDLGIVQAPQIGYTVAMDSFFTARTVPIDQISMHDRRFCISYPLIDQALFASIRTVGIIQPVILAERTPFLVVTGFKRLTAALELGHEKIPAVIRKLKEGEALIRSIHDNIHRGLNLVEKAHAVDRMMSLGFAGEEIYDTMALLGLQSHGKVLERLVALASAEEPLKRFVVEHSLSMKNVAYLLRFEEEERASLIGILSMLHLTESTVREICEMVSLIKIRNGAIPFETLRGVTDTHDLKTKLKGMTHPGLSALHREFSALQQRAALPPTMDIKVDPFFEKEYIDISIRAKDEKDVAGATEKLRTLVDDGHMRSILELTKGHVR